MQTELNGMTTARPIRISGINAQGAESGNEVVTTGRRLPWLQDTLMDNVTGAWGATLRDVVILDAMNRPIGVFNLTTHSLTERPNYDALRNLLLDAARR